MNPIVFSLVVWVILILKVTGKTISAFLNHLCICCYFMCYAAVLKETTSKVVVCDRQKSLKLRILFSTHSLPDSALLVQCLFNDASKISCTDQQCPVLKTLLPWECMKSGVGSHTLPQTCLNHLAKDFI